MPRSRPRSGTATAQASRTSSASCDRSWSRPRRCLAESRSVRAMCAGWRSAGSPFTSLRPTRSDRRRRRSGARRDGDSGRFLCACLPGSGAALQRAAARTRATRNWGPPGPDRGHECRGAGDHGSSSGGQQVDVVVTTEPGPGSKGRTYIAARGVELLALQEGGGGLGGEGPRSGPAASVRDAGAHPRRGARADSGGELRPQGAPDAARGLRPR
jgi:hypothetical protein